MKAIILIGHFITFLLPGLAFIPSSKPLETQDFEERFVIVNHPDEFLPGWSANELSDGSSRVFQAVGQGLDQSHALGIQPIGSFNAQIYIKIATVGVSNPTISFQARTGKNGSGNRPALVYFSFSENLEEGFSERSPLGDAGTFPNEDGTYSAYSIPVPEKYWNLETLTVLMEVAYGSGSGTAARFYMDEFSVHSGEDQTEELTISSLEVMGENTLSLQFNQPVSLDNEGIILNNRYGKPEHVTFSEPSVLLLEFADRIYTNDYLLEFERIEAVASGQVLENWEYSFSIETPTPPGSLIINELMADPNPKGQVPPDQVLPSSSDAEYIELFSRLDKPIQLRGFTYNGVLIESQVMEPLSYLILCSPATRPALEPYGQVASVSPFRTLPNSSGTTTIRDGFGNLMDSLEYSEAFYRGSEKAAGGWSIERINPFQTCSDRFNWMASTAPAGGTPGKQNAVFSEDPDSRPFQLLEVFPLSADRIQLTFSKALPQELGEMPPFTLLGQHLQVIEHSANVMVLDMPEAMVSGNRYQLEPGNLVDCYGVPLESEIVSFLFDAEPPRLASVWGISEKELLLVFDEELDSISASRFQNYRIVDQPIEILAAQRREKDNVHLQLEDPLQIGADYTVRVDSISDRYGNSLSAGEIRFTWENYLDSLAFYAPTILNVQFAGSVSLESAMNPENYQLQPDFVQPSRVLAVAEVENAFLLVFDREFPQNQELILEITGIKDREGKDRITFSHPIRWDTRAIQLSELGIPSSRSLLLEFNKALDPKWAAINHLYEINEGVGSPESVSLPGPSRVLLEFSSEFTPGKSYRLQIKNLKDLYGEEMTQTISRSFSWDTLPPKIDSAYLLSPYELQLVWSKAINPPDSVLVDGKLEKTFSLSSNGLNLRLHAQVPLTSDILDIRLPMVQARTGEITLNEAYKLDHSQFTVSRLEIWDNQTIQVTFTDFPDPGSILFPENYRVDMQSPKEVRLMENGYQISISLKENLMVGDTLQASIASVKGANGKASLPREASMLFDDGILSLWMENAQLLQIRQRIPLDKISPWDEDFHFLEDDRGLEALLNQSKPEQIQVIIDEPLPVGALLTLQIPIRNGEAGDRLPGSLRPVSWSPLAPDLLEVQLLPENRLLLHFDKELNPVLAVVPGFYSLNGNSPSWVNLENSGKEVELSFANGWELGEEISLLIKELEDLDGNTMLPVTMTLTYQPPEIPAFRELTINEMMPAPRPGSGLPDVEYLELFNPTDKTFHLGGMKLSNSRSEITLPRASLGPGEYLILCPASHAEFFDRYGKVLGLNSWPTLLNGGDVVTLTNSQGILVDRVNFDPSMPLGSEIGSNGYSLEVVNPYYPCESITNYAPSNSENKGTPGGQNSVFDDRPDRTAPRLLAAVLEDESRIILRFSKPTGTHNQNSEFTLSPDRIIKASYKDSLDQFQWVLLLQEPLLANQVYEVNVENWQDCAGNALSPVAKSLLIRVPGTAVAGDLLLNEILFNPASGVPKFVEIYNNSERYLNLKNWKLANASEDNISNRRVISGQDLILDPFDYLVLTTDTKKLAEQYPLGKHEKFLEMSLPSYPIRSGTVILLDPEENWVERLDYDEDFHHPFLRDVKGISLERYSVTAPTNNPENWHSAGAHVGHASPGDKNSQVYELGNSEFGIQLSPEVFIPMAAGEQPFTTISYKMAAPGIQATLRIFSPTGIPVKVVCQNEIWGAEGFYTWDGSNESGEKVTAGYYILSAELIHPDGQVQHIKKTVVVGAKF
ncbi:lamin tail domain-containing protein [Cyclobacterium jeungdonense]|uniref:Lamin tail domain-containing protein n=1 Tax=Cyclobacterium jeungdonense TaxID=708087 RepID=A0ABT8C4U2_9BACT|nr:lamin tail domain-containing protein [Cyclobacterium jeungdonense]MDN3687759.1 lamin tail domain-containing protein [Cyclobacterium jeungdonense]